MKLRIGPYDIVREIGRDHLGILYEATDGALGRRVVLRVLHADLLGEAGAVAHFRRDATTAARLDHPAIARVFGMGEDDGSLYVAREFVDGMTARRRLESAGSLTTDEVIAIGIQVASALRHAHGAGFVHRSLRLECLWLPRAGGVKVTGFEEARMKGAERSLSGRDVPVEGVLAPELVWGERVDERTDLYALGALLYELRAGRSPFESATAEGLLKRALLARPGPIPGLDATSEGSALQALVRACLEKDPRARPATAEVVEDRLRQALPPAREDGERGSRVARSARARGRERAGLAERPALARSAATAREVLPRPAERARAVESREPAHLLAFLGGALLALALAVLLRAFGPPRARDLVARAEEGARYNAEGAGILLWPLLDSAPPDEDLGRALLAIATGLGQDHPLSLGHGVVLLEPYTRPGRLPAPQVEGGWYPASIGQAMDAIASALARRPGGESGALGARVRRLRAGPGAHERASVPGADHSPLHSGGDVAPPPPSEAFSGARPPGGDDPDAAGRALAGRPAGAGHEADGVRTADRVSGSAVAGEGEQTWPRPEPAPRAEDPARDVAEGARQPAAVTPIARALVGAEAPTPVAAREGGGPPVASGPVVPSPTRPVPAVLPLTPDQITVSARRAVCAAARAGRYAQAVRLLDEMAPEDLDAGAADALAGVVYFNASFLAVKDGRCPEGLTLARRAALHDDPWSFPSNLGWLRTLELIPRCQDFNLRTAVQILKLKDLPADACGLEDPRSRP